MQKYGLLRRTILFIIALAFLFLSLAMLVPLVEGRTLSQDDTYAIWFVFGMSGFIALGIFWVVWDMGRKNRQEVSVEDINAAALPHVMNLSDDIDLDL